MIKFAVTHPSAFIARNIEDLILTGENSKNLAVKAGCAVLSRAISLTIFPVFLTLELVFKRIPKLLASLSFSHVDSKNLTESKFHKNIDKIQKFGLSILCSPLGLHSADAVSTFFLKNIRSDTIVKPFGVEGQYGKTVTKVHYPETVEALQELVKQAKEEKKQISIIGAGMSQGPQTVPTEDNHLVIHTKNLKKIELGKADQTVTVGAGATWEQIQMAANSRGKSVIVKQASDLFSVGGSIGINCHGWAHEYGAISSTVESLDVIDANGELKTLNSKDELFGCMFGTLGYFGVVVSAKLKLTDNVYLYEKTKEVELNDFISTYKKDIKDKDIPLFGGRLVLDTLDGNPLRKVCMVRYERINQESEAEPIVTKEFTYESKYGTRAERIALQALASLSQFSVRHVISRFWSGERASMLAGRKLTRNEALHPPINAFRMLHASNLHAQWLQEFFIKEENLPDFLRFLGDKLQKNGVRLINATIRPTPKDSISILPYAEQDRYAVVICFDQRKTEQKIERTKKWIQEVNQHVISQGDVYYQAYMPFATREDFEKCYGMERVNELRRLKQKYDPDHVFGNGHTAKYFDLPIEGK